MPSIADLLADDVRAKLVTLDNDNIADVTAVEPEGLPAEVLDHALLITPGKGKMLAVCVCGEEIEINRTPPKGHENTPRVPLCVPCAKEILAGRQGVVIRKPRTAKRKPRTTDGIDHPVVTTTAQEAPMTVNLDTLSDAETGKRVKAAARAQIAETLPAKRKKAQAKKAKAGKAEAKAHKREKVERATLDLPEFTVKGYTVPALDVSEVSSLDEVVSAQDRSIYNKARYRVPGATKETLSKDATWRDLVAEHQVLHQLALAAPAEKAKPAKPAKASKAKAAKPAKKERVAVAVDLDARAVAAIMSARGVSEKKARKILASV